MPNDLDIKQKELNAALNDSLVNAAAIITKDYLSRLEKYEIMKPSTEDIDIDIAQCGKFYQLSRLVMNYEENFLNKLTTIVNVASSIGCSIATVIKSNGYKIDYYFGILSKNNRGTTEADETRRCSTGKSDGIRPDGAVIGGSESLSEACLVQRSQLLLGCVRHCGTA